MVGGVNMREAQFYIKKHLKPLNNRKNREGGGRLASLNWKGVVKISLRLAITNFYQINQAELLGGVS